MLSYYIIYTYLLPRFLIIFVLFSFSATMLFGHPFGLHYSMFIPTIEGQGTDEQIQEFLPRAKRLEIIGTYAQTELGHGKFLQYFG